MKTYPYPYNIGDKFIHREGWCFLVGQDKIYRIVRVNRKNGKYKLSRNGYNKSLCWMTREEVDKQFVFLEIVYDKKL